MKNIFSFGFVVCLLMNVGVYAQSTPPSSVVKKSDLSALVALKAEMTKNNQIGYRYKIQLGSYSTIGGARAARSQFLSKYAGFSAQLEYEAPNYKVWVGNFTNRLSAERVFIKLKDEFRSAFIFKPHR